MLHVLYARNMFFWTRISELHPFCALVAVVVSWPSPQTGPPVTGRSARS